MSAWSLAPASSPSLGLHLSHWTSLEGNPMDREDLQPLWEARPPDLAVPCPGCRVLSPHLPASSPGCLCLYLPFPRADPSLGSRLQPQACGCCPFQGCPFQGPEPAALAPRLLLSVAGFLFFLGKVLSVWEAQNDVIDALAPLHRIRNWFCYSA